MNKPIYQLRVLDYCLPSFCSGDKYYYGTEDSIMQLLEYPEDQHPDTIAAAQEYFSGKGPGKATLFGEPPEEIIKPVEVIDTATYEKDNINFKFFNIYQCEHDINIEHMKTELLYIVDTNQKLKRCIKTTLSNVSFGGIAITELWSFWGLPGFITIKGNSVRNTLYYDDTTFKTKGHMKRDIHNPHKPYLRNFFLEVVGDG